MSEQQFVSADPHVAIAALGCDEAKVLKMILAVMCQNAEIKQQFERFWCEAYGGMPHYSPHAYDDRKACEMMDSLRNYVCGTEWRENNP